MEREGPLKPLAKMKWMAVTTYIIGIILSLIGATMMFFDIGPMPVRITWGILGFILIATSSPLTKALMS
jgi:hypothetical protein